MQWLKRFTRDDRGQDLIEYALVVAFVGFAAVVGVTRMSAGMNGAYANINVGVQPLTASSGSGVGLQQNVSTSTTGACPGERDGSPAGCAHHGSGK